MSGFDDPYWNSLQLLGWVYLRAPDVVNRCSDDGGGVRWHLEEANVPGKDGEPERRSFEEPSRKPSTLTIDLHANYHTARPFSTREVAEQDIHRKLQKGTVTATAEPNHGKRQEIASLDWLDMLIEYDENSAAHKRRRAMRYTDLRFDREQVLRSWPDPVSGLPDSSEPSSVASSLAWDLPKQFPRKAGIRTTGQADAETECGKWILKRGQEWKAGREDRLRKPDALEQGRDAVKNRGHLSEKAFERAWAANAPEEWKRAGAPKGGKHQKRHP
jgi:hypothetical protein